MLDSNIARRQMIEQQVRAWAVLDLERARGHGARAARGVRAARLSRARVRRHERAARPRPEHAGARSSRAASCSRSTLRPDDAVLEVGTGSGYFAACLGALARSVRVARDLPGPRGRGPRQPRPRRRAQRHRRRHADAFALRRCRPLRRRRADRARCPCTTRASSAGWPSAAGCSSWSARAPSWRRGGSPARTRRMAAREPVRDGDGPLVHAAGAAEVRFLRRVAAGD